MRYRWIALAMAIVTAGAVAFGVLQSRRVAEFSSRLTAAENRATEMESRLAELASRPEAPPQVSGQPAPITREPVPPAVPRAPVDNQEVRAMREKLQRAEASLSALQARVQELDTKVQDLSADNQRLSNIERELSEDLSSVNRVVNAMRTELKGKDERIATLEIANSKFKEQVEADSGRLRELTKVSQELQDIHRRRDVYLTSLLRRYREVTEQYRALSGVMENRPDSEAPPVSNADLARIQTAINMAEDDLRQVNSLTAQALRLQKRLAGK